MITLNSSRATSHGLHIIRAFSMIWPWCIIQECKGGRVFLFPTTIEGLNFFQVLLCWCFARNIIPPCFVLQYVIFNLLWVLLFNLSIVIYLSLVNTSKSIHLYNSSPDFNYFLCQCISMYFFRSVSMFTKTRLSIVPLLVCSKRRHTLYIITLYSHRWQCGISMTSFPISQTVVKSGVC